MKTFIFFLAVCFFLCVWTSMRQCSFLDIREKKRWYLVWLLFFSILYKRGELFFYRTLSFLLFFVCSNLIHSINWKKWKERRTNDSPAKRYTYRHSWKDNVKKKRGRMTWFLLVVPVATVYSSFFFTRTFRDDAKRIQRKSWLHSIQLEQINFSS